MRVPAFRFLNRASNQHSPKKTKPDRLADRQIRSAVGTVGEARRVLRDERHRLFQASRHTAMAVTFIGPMINC